MVAQWYDVQKNARPGTFRASGNQVRGRRDHLPAGRVDFSGRFVVGPGRPRAVGEAGRPRSAILNPHFTFRGIGVDFKEGPLEIGGEFLKNTFTHDGEEVVSYDGMLRVQFEQLNLAAIGSYSQYHGHNSVFAYLVLDYPLGGPAFFFVTGLAAGFGYNRDFHPPSIDGVVNFPLVAEAVVVGSTQPVLP